MGGIVMDDCCANNVNSANYPKSHTCPENGKSYHYVKRKTVLHHIVHPWRRSLPEQGYYFCSDPNCDIVYFGQDNTMIHADSVRTTVWQKSGGVENPFCYCFGVTKKQACADKNIKAFIIAQTKNFICSCETSNPSGRCCLKDFPAQ
jgi:hypothetical protein